MKRAFRKPLVVIAPKKLLKFNKAQSDIEDFKEGLRFKRIIEDTHPNLVKGDQVKKLVFCSGQVYYDLENARTTQNINNIAIVRVEQLCPFPFTYINDELKKYPNATVTWS